MKGPSVTTGAPVSNETRTPADGGCRPSSVIRTPASLSASLYFIIAATASLGGVAPGAAASYPRGIIIIINRIVLSVPGPALTSPEQAGALVNKTIGVLRYRQGPEN